jgi:hypothetical protein
MGYPMMPTEYIVPIVGGNVKDNTLKRVLISRITKLKKLQEVRMQVAKTTITRILGFSNVPS